MLLLLDIRCVSFCPCVKTFNQLNLCNYNINTVFVKQTCEDLQLPDCVTQKHILTNQSNWPQVSHECVYLQHFQSQQTFVMLVIHDDEPLAKETCPSAWKRTDLINLT